MRKTKAGFGKGVISQRVAGSVTDTFTWSSSSTSAPFFNHETWGLGSPHTVHVKLRVCRNKNELLETHAHIYRYLNNNHAYLLLHNGHHIRQSSHHLAPVWNKPLLISKILILAFYIDEELRLYYTKKWRMGWLTHSFRHRPQPWDT